MGGFSLKKAMFWKKKKKKKSPLNKAFSDIKKVLPKKKKRRSIFQKKDKQSKKKFSLTKGKKSSPPPPLLLKRLTLGGKRKESLDSASGEKKDKGGLGRVGEQIKKKLSLETQKEMKTQAQISPPENLKEEPERSFKVTKLKDIMRSNRSTEPKQTRKLS